MVLLSQNGGISFVKNYVVWLFGRTYTGKHCFGYFLCSFSFILEDVKFLSRVSS